MANLFLDGAPIEQVGEHDVYTFTVNHDAPADKEAAAELLCEAVEFAHTHLRNPMTTAVVDVQLPIIPGFVHRATEMLVGYGAGLVVLHRGRCSLDADCGFPESLQSAIALARRRSPVWHPLRAEPVFMLRPRYPSVV